jgi:hypothetical protein
MAFSRYRNVARLDGKFFSTSKFPSQEQLDAINVVRVRVSNFDRLDNLAFKYLGSGEYWWIIALMNDLQWAFGFEEGQILKIPVDVNDALRLF